MYRLVLATQPSTLASTTDYTVYRLVLATQPSTLAGYTVKVLATQSLLNNAASQLVTKKKKKKKKRLAKYRPVAVKIDW